MEASAEVRFPANRILDGLQLSLDSARTVDFIKCSVVHTVGVIPTGYAEHGGSGWNGGSAEYCNGKPEFLGRSGVDFEAYFICTYV